MIVHRRQIDVGGGDDVAQRDVAEAAIGVKPFGGGEDRGAGLIGRHGLMPFRHSGAREARTRNSSCISDFGFSPAGCPE